jgi:TPR repeat protein
MRISRPMLCLLAALAASALPAVAQDTSAIDPGSTAFMHGEYDLAMQEWSKKAAAGDAEAMNNIGILYNKGLGVAEDAAGAAGWYRKSAELGFANGQFNLANLLYNGNGVDRDLTQSAAWYHEAAQRGHLGAQYFLGLMYAEGEGVAEDKIEALKWIVKSADGGNAAAQYEVGRMLVAGDGLQADPAKGAEYALKAAHAGNAQAALLMAQLYAEGNGVEENGLEAYVWARIAADRLKSGHDSNKAAALVDDMQAKLDAGAIEAAEKVISLRNRNSGGANAAAQ